ncbi:DinB family protein [Rhizobium sp. Root1220]|uniref:DinB family protein n=1 Tax=Rhizobium sp. Root1220 TaxID=1736432 RepID=UPI0006F45EC9|nr:DinB family protein [Rhizobium sp. Root1220]KQV63960.1 diguanylate cyclase [Rhizobium sp. Root1220]
MLQQYEMFSNYNRWANDLVYSAASELTDAEFRDDKGAFFGSLHRTLNHLITADRIWMKRFTGTGEAPAALDSLLYDDFASLSAARHREDQRIIDWVTELDDRSLAADFTYTPITRPVEITQPLWTALSHFFNHQTHHRGQCHMTLTALGKPSLGLDLGYFLRQDGKRWLQSSSH